MRSRSPMECQKSLWLVCSVSGSKVLNNPLESAFIAAEQMEPSVYDASYLITISQFPSTL